MDDEEIILFHNQNTGIYHVEDVCGHCPVDEDGESPLEIHAMVTRIGK